jgi:serine/threonine protein kinase
VPPRIIGTYEVLSVIGRGGVGTVYRAQHRDTGERVAIKVLAPPPACEASAARRLAREFEALRGLHHPNVVHVHEAGVYEGYSFLAMELVDGLDLRSYLSPAIDEMGDGSARAGDLPADLPPELDVWSSEPETRGLLSSDERSWDGTGCEALREFAALMAEPDTDRGDPITDDAPPARQAGTPAPVELQPLPEEVLERLNRPQRIVRLRDAMLQVCDGLGYVHRRGLVHRDLKPSNIMVDALRRARIMDFGLVKLASDPADGEHCVVGTYLYMAPEQAHGRTVDARSDLYSLGVVLFELLCGRPPFLASTPEQLWEQITVQPAPPARLLNPWVDPELAQAAERLLAKRPRDRFQSADELADALREAHRSDAFA